MMEKGSWKIAKVLLLINELQEKTKNWIYKKLYWSNRWTIAKEKLGRSGWCWCGEIYYSPKQSRGDILRTEVDILNYEKVSVSVINYKVYFKNWVWEILISFIK